VGGKTWGSKGFLKKRRKKRLEVKVKRREFTSGPPDRKNMTKKNEANLQTCISVPQRRTGVRFARGSKTFYQKKKSERRNFRQAGLPGERSGQEPCVPTGGKEVFKNWEISWPTKISESGGDGEGRL